MKRPRLMAIVPTDYDSLRKKGVSAMLLERDEGGFFDRVVTVHPVAPRDRVIELAPGHTVVEFGLGPLQPLGRHHVLRWLAFGLHFLRLVPMMVALARRERIDLVRAHDPCWVGLMGWLVSRLLRRPLCISLHSDPDLMQTLKAGGATYTLLGMRWPARLATRFVLSHADLVLPISHYLRDWALRAGARPETMVIIPHGVDLRAFLTPPEPDFRARFGIPEETRVISFVGRICLEKFVRDVMQAARAVLARRRDCCFVLVGGGEEEENVRREMADEPNFLVLGFQPREVGYQLRQISAVALNPVGGFSLIEACAAGKPVVAYDIEWQSHLVKTGQTGFLVSEGDVAGMIEGILFCLEHPEEAERMGKNARELAFRDHEIGATSAVKRRAYERVL